MRFISICSGIEAASVAFAPLGWKAIAFSEIEPFPCAVLAHHYPDVPNFGDMTKFREWPEEIFIEADAIVGGPPCQAFSVAGNRNGLNDDRGNLTLIYSELIDHADAIRGAHGKPPVIVLYENVPGLLSDKTNAFGCFLGKLAGEDCVLKPPGGKWANAGCVFGPKRAIAWRVFDAQYFGLAQRRRRVFVVASARDGFDPTTVLFEFDGVRRDTAPSREAGKGFTADVAPSLAASGRGVERIGETRGQDPVVAVPQPIPINLQVITRHESLGRGTGFGLGEPGEPAYTIGANHMHGVITQSIAFDSRQDPVSSEHVFGALGSSSPQAQSIAYGIRTANTSSNGWGIQEEVTHTLDFAQGTAVAHPVCVTGEITHTLRAEGFDASEDDKVVNGQDAENDKLVVCMDSQLNANYEIAPTLRAAPGGLGYPAGGLMMAVRRLTPEECEKLQGFPPGYTMIPWRKKPAEDCPDGPRYKALGNSWAVPNVRWIGERIMREGLNETT